jgi:hypothetical protein
MTAAPQWVEALAVEGFTALDEDAASVASVIHDDRRNSDLYWCRATTGQKVLVKRGRNWDDDTAASLHVALANLRARLRAHGDPVVTPEPLASRHSPPGICMTVVEGLPAKRLMRGEIETMSDGVASGMPHDRLVALARLSGEALGWYHTVHCHAVDAAAVEEAGRAFDNLRSTRLLRRVGTEPPLITDGDVSFSWNDFGFHNVLVTPDERACLLDVPPVPEPRVVHRDVARALAELSERYRARHGPWIGAELRPVVAAAFLDGYAAATGRRLDTERDAMFLQFHEAQAKIRRARRKVESRDWVEAVPAVGAAVKAYVSLRQANSSDQAV